MDGQNESFLLKIATEVENLLTNEANRKVFQRYDREFHKELAVYQRAYDQRQQKVEEYRKKSFQDERLRDKRSGPPKKRYVWYDDSYLRTGDPDKGFWGPPCKELDQYPGLRLVSIPSKCFGISPKNHKETIKKSYRSLIIIHDCLRKDFASISKDTWPASLAGLVGCLDFNLTDEEQTNIEIALEYVKADLAKLKPAERKGILRKIPYWIYIFILFLAALLTCLYYLGWLEPIKEFICKILWRK
jgi:hypothetical protein